MTPRPRIKPHLRPLRRGKAAVQFGLDPGPGAVVLEGLTEREVGLVLGLDGTRTRRALATFHQVDPARLDAILDLLGGAHLLVPGTIDRAHLAQLPPALAAGDLGVDAHALGMVYAEGIDGLHYVAERAHSCVLVDGTGPLPHTVATALRAGGVGTVLVGESSVDEVDLDLRSGRHPQHPSTTPDFVILTASNVLTPDRATPWQRRGVAHLPVVAEPHRVTVGPLMGISVDAPCVSCQHLLRADRDPLWPALVAQSHAPGPRPATTPGRRRPTQTETSLTHLVAGVVAMVTFTYLDGQPTPSGMALEVCLPWPDLTQRRWSRHPHCSAHGSATATARASEHDRGDVHGGADTASAYALSRSPGRDTMAE